MKKLLLVCSNYWPENTGIGAYATDLAENAFSQEYEVTVLTGLPHYPWWKIPQEYAHMGAGSYQQNGVKIFRSKHLVPPSGGAIGRVKLEFSFWRNARKVAKSIRAGEVDEIVAIMPTVASGLIARQISSKSGANLHVVFQDISSAGARESGMPGAKWFERISRFLEIRTVRASSNVAIVSPAMRKAIEHFTSNAIPITLIRNYSIQDFEIIPKEIARSKFNFDIHDFIFIHTGNIGYKQDLINLIEAGELIQNKAIKIYIVGHGNQETVIRNRISGSGNLRWFPSVSSEDYGYLLASADVLLINERASQISMSLPSKATSYISSRKPILAAVPNAGPTHEFLKGYAHIVDAGKPQLLAKAMEELAVSQSKLESFSEKQHLLGEQLSRSHAYKLYLEWINQD